MKRKTSLKYSINKKEKNNVKFQSYRSHAASEHLLIHHIHIVSRWRHRRIWDAKNHLPYARKATAEKLLGDRYILTVQPATIAEILGDKKVTLNTSIYVNQNVTGDQTRAGLDMPSYAAKFMDEDNVIHPAVIHVAFYEALDQAMKFPEVEKAKRLDPNNFQRAVDNIHEIAIKKYGDKSSADYRYVELVRRYIVVHFQQTCGSRYTNFK